MNFKGFPILSASLPSSPSHRKGTQPRVNWRESPWDRLGGLTPPGMPEPHLRHKCRCSAVKTDGSLPLCTAGWWVALWKMQATAFILCLLEAHLDSPQSLVSWVHPGGLHPPPLRDSMASLSSSPPHHQVGVTCRPGGPDNQRARQSGPCVSGRDLPTPPLGLAACFSFLVKQESTQQTEPP